MSDLPTNQLARLLDSVETEQLGFTPSRRWKWLGAYRARSYVAYPDENVYFTFSLRPRGKDDTSICVVLWDTTAKR
ncbi:hypothetical protein [Deinococcus pimensis]|uniref:hypothetical protein n=1 Tax=Deinococcus pimensis TaxID=309888 RepID=UPI0012FA2910|nr:hypothetical protein [Deinococcus pimensis]